MLRSFLRTFSMLVLCATLLFCLTACKKKALNGPDAVRKAATSLIGVSPEAIIFVNLKSLRNNAAAKKIYKEQKDKIQKELMKNFKKGKCSQFIDVDQVDAMAMVIFAKPAVAYIATNGTFDAKKAIACITEGKKVAATINGIPVYQNSPTEWVYAASKTSVVMLGKTPAKKKFAVGSAPMELGDFLKKLQPGKSALGKGMFGAVAGQVLTIDVAGLEDIKLPKLPMIKLDLSLKSIQGYVTLGENLGLALNITLGEEKAAKKLFTMYSMFAPGLQKKAPKHLQAIAKSLKLTQKGATLAVTFSHSLNALADLGVKAMSKFVNRSKNAEAALNLQALKSGAVSWFDAEHSSSTGDPLPKAFPSDSTNGTAAVQSFTLPAAKPCADGKNPLYPKNAAIWNKQPWKSLRFGITKPHYFQYTYKRGGNGAKAWFELIAKGDPGCTGKLTIFKAKGKISAATGEVDFSRPKRVQ